MSLFCRELEFNDRDSIPIGVTKQAILNVFGFGVGEYLLDFSVLSRGASFQNNLIQTCRFACLLLLLPSVLPCLMVVWRYPA